MAKVAGEVTLPPWAFTNQPASKPAPKRVPAPPRGKAASLAANERTSTPKGPLPKPAPKRKPVPVNTATVTKANPNLGKTSTKPFFPGQKPDHYIPVGRGGSVPIYKYGLGSSGQHLDTVLGAPARGQTESQSQAALEHVYRQNHPVGQQVIEGIAQGVPGVALAKAVRDNKFGVNTLASEAFNDVSSGLVPAGKAAGILGGFGAFRKIRGASDALKAAEEAGAVTPAAERAMTAAQIRSSIERGGPLPEGRPDVVATGKPVEKTTAQKIQGGLKGAKIQRGKQEALYSAERAKRASAAEQAMQSIGGVEGHAAAKAALRGELPKIEFKGFGELTPTNLEEAFRTVQTHPHLMPYQKIRINDALQNAVEHGKVPGKADLNLIEHVFGKDLSGTLKDPAKLSLWSKAIEVLNVPRSLMASFDVSAPFRQGLVVGARHPRIFFRNFAPMFKSLGSEKAYRGVMEDIVHRPSFPMMQEAKLALTDFEHGLQGQEEQFIGHNYAEKIPVAGKGVRASGRAYTAFLNKTRADTFDHLIRVAQSQGVNVQDEKFLRSLGKYINSATGRGTYGNKALEQALPAMNAVFFSPRLLASRLNFLNPHFYYTLDPFARRQALRAAFQTLGAGSTVLGLAALAGAKVGQDPRNADFGKIKFGHTRIDIWGGFQQPMRLLAQLASGKVISSTTGRELHLGPEGPGNLTRKDIVERFFAGKLAPTPSFIYDYLSGGNLTGQKFNAKNEIEQRMIPLLMQDAHDLYKDRHGGLDGISAALAGYGVGAFGVGLQTYGQKQAPGPTIVPSVSFPQPGGSGSQQGGGVTLPPWAR